MNLQKTIVLAAVCVGLSFTDLLSPAASKGQTPDGLQWGTTVDNLQMSVAIADARRAAAPELQFIIRNVGEKDTVLNLGSMLANGHVQLPGRIGLILTDAHGKTRKFDFFDGRYPAVAGRRDDYIVPLRSGSTYGLKIGLDKFYSSGTNETGLQLPSGTYRMTAQFEGDGAEVRDLLITSWKGNLQSNTLTFEK